MGSIVGGLAAMIVGGAIASATVFGLVSNQTEGPATSPVNAGDAQVSYGSTE